MLRNPFNREGTYRFTLASLVALILFAMTGGVILERQVLAAFDPARDAQLDLRLIAQADGLIEEHYVDRSAVRPQRLTYAAISGMVDSLGDTGHSAFLTPGMVRANKQQLQGHFPGIGAEVRMRDKQVVIVAPLDGSPAQKAGLRAGDIIFKVDGRDVAGQTLEQVVSGIRGPAGTKVVLAIRDPGTDHTRSVEIVRAVIHPQLVSWHLVPGTRIADLRIAAFSEGAAKRLRHAIVELRAAGASAVVLDLRDDPGGLLTQAVAVASEFLPHGNVLLEKDSRGKLRPVAVEPGKDRLQLPVAVLVNAGTASAAEIVAGALQDARRAAVVGEKTFGTGTVLREFGLPDGSALMLAVGEWLTPDGHTIWHKGIEPNVKVALATGVAPVFPETLATLDPARLAASRDAQLLEALALLRSGEQALADESAGARPRRTGEQPAADVGRELVQHVDLGHAREDPDESGARVALVALEQQAGIERDQLPPGRPALGDFGQAVVVGEGAPQDLRAAVVLRRRQRDVRILGDERIAVLVHRLQVERVEFVLRPERRARGLVAADRLLLERYFHPVPVLERDADRAHHHVAAVAHPVRAFIADPDELAHRRRIAGGDVHGPVLESHRNSRCCTGLEISGEPHLRPAHGGDAGGRLGQAPHRGLHYLGIVRAGLERQVAAGALRDQLIAGEARQVDQGLGSPLGQTEPVLAVFLEQARTETEGERQARDRKPDGRAGLHARLIRVRLRIERGRSGSHFRRGVGPGAQQRDQVVALGRRQIEGDEIGVALGRGRDTALMFAPEWLDFGSRSGRACRKCALGERRGDCSQAGAREELAPRRAVIRIVAMAHGVATRRELMSSST